MALDGDLLNPVEAEAVQNALQQVADSLSRDAETIRAATQALSQATDEFAARRMDKAIAKALSGQSIDNL